ncbi:MAG: hypothetical protein EHM42_14760 [Planctomycetaceae bacterium]|nr:MAG: hypothetical protein EHM42_14760 [Planctomycetaceae bacterium]
MTNDAWIEADHPLAFRVWPSMPIGLSCKVWAVLLMIGWCASRDSVPHRPPARGPMAEAVHATPATPPAGKF